MKFYYCSTKNLTKAIALFQLVVGTLAAAFIGVSIILSLKDFIVFGESYSEITNSSSSSEILGLVFNEAGQNSVINTESVTYSAVVSPVFESDGGSSSTDSDVDSESLIGETTTEINGFENISDSDSINLNEPQIPFSILNEQLIVVVMLVGFSCTIVYVVMAWELWKGASENNYWRCNAWLRFNVTWFILSILILVGEFVIKILPFNIYMMAATIVSWLVSGIFFGTVYVFMKDLHKTNMDIPTTSYSSQK